jgi:uncharacterized protein
VAADVVLSFPSRRREWPLDILNVDQLGADGWRAVPFREFVLKMHSRCNLACDHCYVYEMADQTWRSRPAKMSHSIVDVTAERIAEHASRHALSYVKVVFHGGEPLLAGHDVIAGATASIRDALPLGTVVDFGVQTNGVLLSEDVLRTFLAHRIQVSVSIDGGAADHDRHRHHANGRGSHAAVAASVQRLAYSPYREIFAGLLCTVDLDNDPIRTYEALLEFVPPALDFLLPHGNWTHPPPRRDEGQLATPYAEWLIQVFDRWYTSPRRETRIRLFEEIISLILGGPSRSEVVGLTPVGLLVVDTDGSIEQVDSLKSAYDGAADTGLHVLDDSFDAALSHPGIAARQIGVAALSNTCKACVVRDVCGGGFYAHRYRAGEGYRNPSVYCPDLLHLIQHIQRHVQRDTKVLVGR